MNRVYFILLVVVFFGRNLSIAQFGTLDESFDNDGKVLTEFGNYDSAIHSIALQPDNKIVASGVVNDHGTYTQLALARYLPDGTLDTSFGNEGKVVSEYADLRLSMTAMVLQPDGKIVGGGIIYNNFSDSQFILIRYLNDGSIDSAFGENGFVAESFIQINQIALLADGKILAAGFTVDDSQNRDLVLLRYLADGTRDAAFGVNGLSLTSIGEKAFAKDMALQSDGKIVISGELGVGVNYETDALIGRFLPDGTSDITFGDNGFVTLDYGQSDSANSVKIQSDGKIIFAGWAFSNGGLQSFSLGRLMPNGEMDTDFGSNGDGMVFGDGTGLGSRVVVQPDGMIIIAGSSEMTGSTTFAISRFQGNGIPDPTFGIDGVMTTVFSSSSRINAILLQPDGRILAAGEAGLTGGTYVPDFALARYNSGILLDVTERPKNRFSVYPNPVGQTTYLDIDLDSSETLSIDLYDSTGRKIKTLLTQTDFAAGNHSQPLDLPETLAKGIYFLNIHNSKVHQSIRIMK